MTNNTNIQKVCAKLVPNVLTDEQKANRVMIANKLLEHDQIENDIFDNITTKNKTTECNMSKSKVKIIMIVHPGQTVNAVYYVDVFYWEKGSFTCENRLSLSSEAQPGSAAPAPLQSRFGFGKLFCFPKIRTASKSYFMTALRRLKRPWRPNEVLIWVFQGAYRASENLWKKKCCCTME